MLQIIVPKQDLFDEKKQEFISVKETKLQLEHSLVSISKWESKWKKPFLSRVKTDIKTEEEIFDYVKCMTITQNIDPLVYKCLTRKNIDDIVAYIDDPMSATTFYDQKNQGKKEVLTSEIIYYYMFSLGIPIECQKWHLNRLLTLIKVFSEKNNPKKKKKMSTREIMERNRSLNEQRKAALNTSG